MKLSIVIVNYNSKDFVIRCIESIKKFYKKEIKEENYEIIIVDNASTDGSRQALEKVPEIIFIANRKNLGFSKANNIGVKKTKGEYV